MNQNPLLINAAPHLKKGHQCDKTKHSECLWLLHWDHRDIEPVVLPMSVWITPSTGNA